MSSFLRYFEDCFEEFVEFFFPEMSDKYPLSNSDGGGEILIGGVFESLSGDFLMNS